MTATRVHTPQARCKIGFARADITPPVGIYHRMWGAATHDRATGVHRPLTATAVHIESPCGTHKQTLLGLDHCIIDANEIDALRSACNELYPEEVFVCLSHTHGSAWLSRSRAHLPGGDLIGPYLDMLSGASALAVKRATASATPATLLFGTGRCALAAHRDFPDTASQQFVCGFHPDGPADDTVLVAKAVADDTGETLGTILNYACHPTTLAWQNTLISPDYVGATREVVEGVTGGPCLFLQGASGDLGPREGYVGDTRVADRNGRELGFAALAALEALPQPGTHFEYTGPVVSGAILGSWGHRGQSDPERARCAQFGVRRFVVPLPYRLDLPKADATRAELAKWTEEEKFARADHDDARAADCRARAEQMTRQLARLAALPPGPAYPFRVAALRWGGAVCVLCPGELYQVFQRDLRARFPGVPIVVSTVTNDWQPGYLPPASSYGYGIYQEVISAVAPGALETVLEVTAREVKALLN